MFVEGKDWKGKKKGLDREDMVEKVKDCTPESKNIVKESGKFRKGNFVKEIAKLHQTGKILSENWKIVSDQENIVRETGKLQQIRKILLKKQEQI